MVSLHNSRIMTKTEVCTGDQGIAVTGLIMKFVGGIWKTFGLWTRKLVGHFKLDLIGHPSRKTEDSVDWDLSCGDPAQEVSEGRILGSDLESILVTFWWRMWLFLALELQMGLKFNWRLLDEWCWQWRCQDSPVLNVLCGYWLSLLIRSLMKKSKLSKEKTKL